MTGPGGSGAIASPWDAIDSPATLPKVTKTPGFRVMEGGGLSGGGGEDPASRLAPKKDRGPPKPRAEADLAVAPSPGMARMVERGVEQHRAGNAPRDRDLVDPALAARGGWFFPRGDAARASRDPRPDDGPRDHAPDHAGPAPVARGARARREGGIAGGGGGIPLPRAPGTTNLHASNAAGFGPATFGGG